MPKPTGNCIVCDAPIPYQGVGRIPKRCAAHRGKTHKNEAATRAKKRAARAAGATELLADFEALGVAGASPLPEAWHAHALAIALGLTSGDARAAAALLGITGTPEQIDALAVAANTKHRPLVERRPQAIGDILVAAMALGAMRLVARMDAIAVNQIPAALKALAQTNIELVGSAMPATGQITINIGDFVPPTEEAA